MAHMRQAMVMPMGMMAAELATAAELPVEVCWEALVSSEPQYQRATT